MTKFVTVRAYNNPIEASLAKGRLEVEGIPAYLAHENHVWVDWVYSQALGGVKVQVLAENAENASKILDAHDHGEYEESLREVVPDIDENICPKCGSKNFRSTFPIGMILLVILTLGFLSVIFPLRRDHHTCMECGYKWRH